MSLLDELLTKIEGLDAAGQKGLQDAIVEAGIHNMPWLPNPGPQMEAYWSEADDLFYGGSAGGGKSDLLCGLCLTAHTKSLLLRRIGDDARDLFGRMETILESQEYGRDKTLLTYDFEGRKVKFAGCQNEDDKQRYKGKPFDLYGFDEISDFTKSQFEFIKTWNRTTKPGQRCRTVSTGNPPTTAEGLWVIDFWGAWLNPKHPNPAREGELRWYVIDKKDNEHEVEGRGPHKIEHDDGTTETLYARSRTFIRAWLKDNPYLMKTGYAENLDSLPAALRAAYRDGRFDLALEDDPWQVIPTSWVRAAQERWTNSPPKNIPMCAIGVDVAQGGVDETVLAIRHDGWFAPLMAIEGKKTPLSKDVVALVIRERRDNALPIIDMGGGYGGGVLEGLHDIPIEAKGYKGAATSTARTKDGQIGFKNKRSEAYWKFREALDPNQPGGSTIALPDDNKMVADLTAPKFSIKRGKGGQMELAITDKADLCKALGRSTDGGDAVIMAWTDGPKSDSHASDWLAGQFGAGREPQVIMAYANRRRK